MIFPDLKDKPFGYVNLNEEAKAWRQNNQAQESMTGRNPLLNPTICQAMVHNFHQRLGLVFSYGGWLEDRSTLWRGSYLDAEKKYLHVGLDLNVPTNTRVAVDLEAEVIRVDDDQDMNGGWGPRVIVKPTKDLINPVVLLFAHLSRETRCKVGDVLKAGQVFTSVGKAPENGNWYPHVHVQAIDSTFYEEILKKDFNQLDGYGLPADAETLGKIFKDPLNFIRLHSY